MAVVKQCIFLLAFAVLSNRTTIIILNSVYCNTEFWSLSSDLLSGDIKIQAFSMLDSFF